MPKLSSKTNLIFTKKPSCPSLLQTHQKTFLSSSTIFQTPNFEIPVTPTNCQKCPQSQSPEISEHCKKTLNSNGDKIIPKNFYKINFGGLPENPKNALICFKSEICSKNAISSVFITNLENGKIFNLKVDFYFPVFLHDILVVEKDNKRIAYFFGGKSEICEGNDNCVTFWKFEIPAVPLFYEIVNPVLVKVGKANNFFGSIFGHSIVYDNNQNRILIYGGVFQKLDNLVYQNFLWSFSLFDFEWRKLKYVESEKKNIFINGKNSEIFGRIEIPETTIFPSLTLKEDDLYVIGGFLVNFENEKINYYQKSWKLNLKTFIWTEITPGYFFFNSELNFDFNKRIKGFAKINFPNYKTYNAISDFSHLSKNYEKSDLYIYDNNFFIILSNTYLFTNKIYFSDYCNKTNENFLIKIGEKLENECSLNGKCVNSKCICEKNFEGENCEIKNCLNNCCLKKDDNFSNLENNEICFNLENNTNLKKKQNINKKQNSFNLKKKKTNKKNSNLQNSQKIQNTKKNIENNKNENPPGNKCLINFPQSYCQCSLRENKGGDNCSKKFCLNDCSDKGVCDYGRGVCECFEHYSGIDCSVLEIVMEVN